MERKNSKLGLGIIIGLMIAAIVGLGAYFICDNYVFDKKDNKNDTEVKPTPSATPTQKDRLTKFESNYTLTKTDKEEIAKAIPKLKGLENVVVDIETITIKNAYDYLLEIDFKEKTNNDSLFAWIIKVDGKFKCENAGSGYLGYSDGTTDLTRYLDKLKQEYGITSTPVDTEKQISLSDASVTSIINQYNLTGKKSNEDVLGLFKASELTNTLVCIKETKAASTNSTMNIYVKMAFLNDKNSDSMANYDVANYYTDNTKSVLVESIQNVEFSKECDKVNFDNEKYPTYVYKFTKDATGNYTYTSVEKVK